MCDLLCPLDEVVWGGGEEVDGEMRGLTESTCLHPPVPVTAAEAEVLSNSVLFDLELLKDSAPARALLALVYTGTAVDEEEVGETKVPTVSNSYGDSSGTAS